MDLIQVLQTYLDVNGQFGLKKSLKFDFDQINSIQPNVIEFSSDASGNFTYGSGTFGTSTFGGKQQTYYEVQTIGSGFSASLIYETNEENVSTTFTIDAATLQYITNARR